jgi:pimeloyl-ACP methyl ester carboxylesterase
MPAVFVHGVPDTARVWQPVIDRLHRKDVVSLSLPGFGNKRPPGFHPDKESYAAWIIGELKKIKGPIDIVGHDWGGLLVTRVVSLEPQLFRSWCVGGAPLDPSYVWHDTAKIWQTPTKGEEFMKMMTPELFGPGLMAQGVPEAEAKAAAAAFDDEMKACILTLYRSATNASVEWFPELKRAANVPALILWGEGDPFAGPTFGEKLAKNVNGTFVVVPGTRHWYELEKPDFTAAALEKFWAELP